MARFRFRLRGFYRGLLFLPMIMPDIVLGIALLIFFVTIGMELSILTVISSPCWPAGSPPKSGRQPYTVYGLLRTADSASPIDAAAVASSLVAFIIVYFLVFGAGTYYLLRLMRRPPDLSEPDIETGVPTRAAGITPAPALGR